MPELTLGGSYGDIERIGGILDLPFEVSQEDAEKIVKFIMQFAPKGEKGCTDCRNGHEPKVRIV